MAKELKDLPLEQREILLVVRNKRDEVTSYFDHLDDNISPNCRLAAVEALKSSFPGCGKIIPGDLMIWDDFSGKYVLGEDFSYAGWERVKALLDFCRDYLGASTGEAYFESENVESKQGSGQFGVNIEGTIPVQGKSNTGNNASGKKISVAAGGKCSSSNKSDLKTTYHEHFNIDSPSPMDLERAQELYESLHWERFSEFKSVLDFRRHHPGAGSHDFKLTFFKETDKKLNLAVDFALKVNILGLKINFDKNSATHNRQGQIVEVKLEYK